MNRSWDPEKTTNIRKSIALRSLESFSSFSSNNQSRAHATNVSYMRISCERTRRLRYSTILFRYIDIIDNVDIRTNLIATKSVHLWFIEIQVSPEMTALLIFLPASLDVISCRVTEIHKFLKHLQTMNVYFKIRNSHISYKEVEKGCR